MANCNSIRHFVWHHQTLTSLAAIITLGFLLSQVPQCDGHGRMIEPPGRATAWRFNNGTTPRDDNDNALYCGGFAIQQKNGGKCGVCGDPWDVPTPRPNEFGGKYGLGVVERKYNQGAEITLRIDLTASHMGYFEFRVCPEVAAQQSCLDKHLLELLGGTPSDVHSDDLSTRFYPRHGSIIYEITGKLPNDLKCTNCLLQWRYIAGNNWGRFNTTHGANGYGPQEEFRACADITIGDVGPQPPLRPLEPSTKATKSTSTMRPTEAADFDTQTNTPDDTWPRYLGLLIAIVVLLAVLCVLVAIYLYNYHGQHIKHIMLYWNTAHKASKQAAATDATYITFSGATTPLPPAPTTAAHF